MPENISIEELREMIDHCGLIYQQISDGCGVSTSTISRIMRGGGTSTNTIRLIASYLSPPMPAEAAADSPQPGVISRDALMLILRQHQEQTTILRKIARQRLRWIVILTVALVSIVGWFLWDLTHPEVGLIRLKQAGYIVGQLLGLAGR